MALELGLSFVGILDEFVQLVAFKVEPLLPTLQVLQALMDLLTALPHVRVFHIVQQQEVHIAPYLEERTLEVLALIERQEHPSDASLVYFNVVVLLVEIHKLHSLKLRQLLRQIVPVMVDLLPVLLASAEFYSLIAGSGVVST